MLVFFCLIIPAGPHWNSPSIFFLSAPPPSSSPFLFLRPSLIVLTFHPLFTSFILSSFNLYISPSSFYSYLSTHLILIFFFTSFFLSFLPLLLQNVPPFYPISFLSSFLFSLAMFFAMLSPSLFHLFLCSFFFIPASCLFLTSFTLFFPPLFSCTILPTCFFLLYFFFIAQQF